MNPPHLQKWVAAAAARTLADLSTTEYQPPETPLSQTAHGEIAGWQVTVTVCRFDGPMRFIPKRLRPIEETILEACPPEAVTIKRLAAIAGYCYNQHFREAVNSLIDRGLLIRSSRGVSRPESLSG